MCQLTCLPLEAQNWSSDLVGQALSLILTYFYVASETPWAILKVEKIRITKHKSWTKKYSVQNTKKSSITTTQIMNSEIKHSILISTLTMDSQNSLHGFKFYKLTVDSGLKAFLFLSWIKEHSLLSFNFSVERWIQKTH